MWYIYIYIKKTIRGYKQYIYLQRELKTKQMIIIIIIIVLLIIITITIVIIIIEQKVNSKALRNDKRPVARKLYENIIY